MGDRLQHGGKYGRANGAVDLSPGGDFDFQPQFLFQRVDDTFVLRDAACNHHRFDNTDTRKHG